MENYKKPLILSKNEVHGSVKGIFPLAGLALTEVAAGAAAVIGFAAAMGEDNAPLEFARSLTERKNFALA